MMNFSQARINAVLTELVGWRGELTLSSPMMNLSKAGWLEVQLNAVLTEAGGAN
jgi:hypothetical protein